MERNLTVNMRRLMAIGAILMSPTVPVVGQTVNTGTGTVVGHVFCNDTQTPCRFATVTLQIAPMESGGTVPSRSKTRGLSAVSDLNGAFQINGVPAGNYYVLGRMPGYVTSLDLYSSEHQGEIPESAKVLDQLLTRITVAPGGVIAVDQTLSRGAAIRGTLRWDDGAPAIDMPIHLFRKDATGVFRPYARSNEDPDLVPLGVGEHSDEYGHFQASALPPGAYVVEATLPAISLLPSTIFGQQSLTVSQSSPTGLEVFSGDKFLLSDAVPIEIKEGETRSDADLTLPTNGLHSLRINVVAKSSGEVIQRGHVQLLNASDKSLIEELEFTGGTAVVNYMPTGSYILAVSAEPQALDHRSLERFLPSSLPLLLESDSPSVNVALVEAK